MRLSLKVKLAALISLLVLVVVVVTSWLYVSALLRFTLEGFHSRALAEAKRVLVQSSDVLNQASFPSSLNPESSNDLRTFARSTLNGDSRLRSFVESAAAFSEGLEFVAITASNGEVVLHNDQLQLGSHLPLGPPFSDLAQAKLYRQLEILYGSPQIYEVDLPVTYGPEKMEVRIGVSSFLLKNTLGREIKKALSTSLIVVLLSTLTAGVLSFMILRPLESISLNVDRLARGELPVRWPSRAAMSGVFSPRS